MQGEGLKSQSWTFSSDINKKAVSLPKRARYRLQCESQTQLYCVKAASSDVSRLGGLRRSRPGLDLSDSN